MSLNEICEWILLPSIAWLLMSANKVEKRMTRLETQMEILIKHHLQK